MRTFLPLWPGCVADYLRRGRVRFPELGNNAVELQLLPKDLFLNLWYGSIKPDKE